METIPKGTVFQGPLRPLRITLPVSYCQLSLSRAPQVSSSQHLPSHSVMVLGSQNPLLGSPSFTIPSSSEACRSSPGCRWKPLSTAYTTALLYVSLPLNSQHCLLIIALCVFLVGSHVFRSSVIYVINQSRRQNTFKWHSIATTKRKTGFRSCVAADFQALMDALNVT